MPPCRLLLALLFLFTSIGTQAAEAPFRVAVIGNSRPMSYVGEDGVLTGFNIGIAQALCETLKRRCSLVLTPLDQVVDSVAAGEFDFAVVSLLVTPERLRKVLMSKPYYRSISLWLAPANLRPGSAEATVAVVRGSAQAGHADQRGWRVLGVASHADLSAALLSGDANAALVPMPTALGLMENPALQALALHPTNLDEPLLSGDVAISIDPRQPALKGRIDAAIDQIKRDGRYDRINTQFLPFRLQ